MLLELDFSCNIPIYQQIRNQIVLAVAEGRLQPGQRIPSMRTLAEESGINMMTVNKAYQLLRQEGYLQIDRRSGARITLPIRLPDASSPPGSKDPAVSVDAEVLAESQSAAAAAALSQLRPQLTLLISEARLHGVSQDAFLKVCHHIFQEQEEV